jgi:hypothetical protein
MNFHINQIGDGKKYPKGVARENQNGVLVVNKSAGNEIDYLLECHCLLGLCF